MSPPTTMNFNKDNVNTYMEGAVPTRGSKRPTPDTAATTCHHFATPDHPFSRADAPAVRRSRWRLYCFTDTSERIPVARDAAEGDDGGDEYESTCTSTCSGDYTVSSTSSYCAGTLASTTCHANPCRQSRRRSRIRRLGKRRRIILMTSRLLSRWRWRPNRGVHVIREFILKSVNDVRRLYHVGDVLASHCPAFE